MSMPQVQIKERLFSSLPPTLNHSYIEEIRATIAENGAKIIVLDDDPTGTQCVHDTTVLTSWEQAILCSILEESSPAAFILTNTRSMKPNDAAELNAELLVNLQVASAETGRNFVLVSRSDSTLRGYFPLETDVLSQTLSIPIDATLIVPAFMAGGRYTINAIHYVAEGENLIPVGETPFAQDSAFGYTHSDLRAWISEKTGGRVQVDDVATITLSDLRVNGIETVTEKLMSLQDGCYCVVDAIDEHDLEVLVLSILHAEQKGKIFLYRSAASFAALRAGITLRPLLTSAELLTNRVGGGLVVVGSYVPKSSQQLEHLLKHTNHYRVEVQVSKLLDNTTQQAEIQRIVESSLPLLKAGATVIIYTSRNLVTGDTAARSLDIGNRVSESLVTITESLCPHTRFLVAKGGITSSDLATKALAVKQARVLGQILPGIPVWELGTDATAPDMVYVVFPGNVGDVDTLTQAVEKLATAVETEGLV